MKLVPITLCAISLVLCFPAVAQDKKPLSQTVKALIEKAEKGDAEALAVLGQKCFYGQGVPQGYKEAFRWYRKSAEQGLAKAQGMLGGMYGIGQGVPQDYVTAYVWANIAAGNGSAQGLKLKEMFAKGMTKEQIADAQKMSCELMKELEVAKAEREKAKAGEWTAPLPKKK